MKEFTEIEMKNCQVPFEEILGHNDWLTFQFSDANLRMFGGGRAGKLIGSNAIKFETQAFYERIPLSETPKGTELEVFKDWRKQEKIADGVIRTRYFEPAKRSSWKVEKELNPTNSSNMDVNLTLNAKEKRMLEFGITPIQMEDKWFSFVEDNTIHQIRSWTGIEIFSAKIEEAEEGSWKIARISCTNDFDLKLHATKNEFINNMQRQISWMKKLMA